MFIMYIIDLHICSDIVSPKNEAINSAKKIVAIITFPQGLGEPEARYNRVEILEMLYVNSGSSGK